MITVYPPTAVRSMPSAAVVGAASVAAVQAFLMDFGMKFVVTLGDAALVVVTAMGSPYSALNEVSVARMYTLRPVPVLVTPLGR
jgi:type III secretory pathway component EscU